MVGRGGGVQKGFQPIYLNIRPSHSQPFLGPGLSKARVHTRVTHLLIVSSLLLVFLHQYHICQVSFSGSDQMFFARMIQADMCSDVMSWTIYSDLMRRHHIFIFQSEMENTYTIALAKLRACKISTHNMCKSLFLDKSP